MFDWEFFIFILVFGFINGRCALWAQHLYNEYREKQFLKHLRIVYPDSVITLSSVEASDAAALDSIKQQLDQLEELG